MKVSQNPNFGWFKTVECITHMFLLLELDEDEPGCGEPMEEPQNVGHGDHWKSASFTT